MRMVYSYEALRLSKLCPETILCSGCARIGKLCPLIVGTIYNAGIKNSRKAQWVLYVSNPRRAAEILLIIVKTSDARFRLKHFDSVHSDMVCVVPSRVYAGDSAQDRRCKTSRKDSTHPALPWAGTQNLAVIVLRILVRHIGQRAPAAMMSLAQPWHVHCRYHTYFIGGSSLKTPFPYTTGM